MTVQPENENYFIEGLNSLKKTVFYEILNIVGRVFIIVRYSDDVMIGNRGFIEEEKENGLILVFNTKMNFTWEDDILEAKLVFGTTPHNCIIPVKDVVAVYSPDIQTQFVVTYQPQSDQSGLTMPEEEEDEDSRLIADSKVVKVDFSKGRRIK